MSTESAIIRPSEARDVPVIAALIAEESFKIDGSGSLLPVSPKNILRTLEDDGRGRFFSGVEPSGHVVGCVSVAVYGMPANYREVTAQLERKLPLERFGVEPRGFGDDRSLVAELRSLAVRDDYRGHGLGIQLIEAAKSEARRRGFQQLYSLVNDHALRLFERAGFHRTTRTPQKLLLDCVSCPLLERCVEVPVVADLETQAQERTKARGEL